MVYSRNGSEPSARGEDTIQLSDDRLYHALASETRRRIVYFLLEEEQATIETLATVLAGWDADETGTMATETNRDRILIELSHSHLPRLDEAEVVTYDRQSGDVHIEPLDPLLSALVSKSVSEGQSAES
ncbi:DUF7344 domain-containing protein [Halobellus captivus]|uniref:DUF7344 domain-containing protein n=1 Tax=Halobellus captivus TaxID=2592614 RepID=UPI00119F7118|nr:ArsR family transcriptional regulator [Halobellus captivus]